MRLLSRTPGLVVVTALIAFALGGCGDDDESTGLKCGAGTHASGGKCIPNIVDGGGPDTLACGAGTHEDNGECVADDAGTSSGLGPIGAACEDGEDCETGFCAGTAINPRLTEGYCTELMCDSETAPCPPGSACISTSGLMACFAYCDPGSDVCRDTLVCQPLSTDPLAAICAPACTVDDDCPAGAVCDVTTGICTPPGTCDPEAPDCATDLTCVETSESPTGGFCFPMCEDATTCKDEEVCQPFPSGDSACVPPPCETTADCPAGATCTIQSGTLNFCALPDDCSTDPCADADKECVSGFCLSSCSEGDTGDTECEAIHPGLTCADSFGACMPACGENGECDEGDSCFETDNVCLPTGAFPGSPCAPADSTHDDPWCIPVGTIDQECYTSGGESLCVPKCTADAECEGISSTLTCFESQGLCLPIGAFPGSACRTTVGDECDINLGGEDEYDMACISDTCLLKCNTDTNCSDFNDTLACYEDKGACFPKCTTNSDCTTGMACLVSEGVCLPAGSFPGGPCDANDACAPVGTLSQTCTNDTCVVDCNDTTPQGGDGLCAAVNPGLTCMPTNPTTGDGSCVYGCVGGLCPNGYTCLEPEGTQAGAQNACLPNGSFPGSACATGDTCGSYGGAAMTCAGGSCVITCTAEATCTAVGLTCVEAAGVCVSPCVSNACDDNRYACLASENACLPNGSFPGGPCNASDACSDYGPTSLPMSCISDTCLVDCDDSAGGDTVCAAVNAALTCDGAFTKACVPRCVSNQCPTGMSCTFDNACLPTGSFPGSPCRTTDPKCDSDLGGNDAVDMVCGGTACVVDCSWNSAVCAAVPGTTCQDTTVGYACLP